MRIFFNNYDNSLYLFCQHFATKKTALPNWQDGLLFEWQDPNAVWLCSADITSAFLFFVERNDTVAETVNRTVAKTESTSFSSAAVGTGHRSGHQCARGPELALCDQVYTPDRCRNLLTISQVIMSLCSLEYARTSPS